ncbi:hypothetical protein GCM10010466_59740 [Planomonospora alba]|uniref:Lipoprotein n=1 Tax=Planomonospora alba TaxID=161354 RepID=A0ABP6NXM1_9ACTN
MVFLMLATGCTAEEPSGRPDTLPVLPSLTPVGDVWPEAVLAAPRELENDVTVIPVASLSADELLLMTTHEHRPTFIGFNVKTERRRTLARAPEWAECGGCFEIQHTAVNATQVAWLVRGYAPGATNGGRRHLELWTMPRTGGPMRAVTRLPGNGNRNVFGFEITDDTAAWWDYEGGIWRVPLAGGEPVQVLPGRRLRVTSWPWAWDEGERTVVNLVTGQEIQVSGGDDLGHLTCGPTWCVGDAGPPYGIRNVALLRLNGSERTTVPGDAMLQMVPIRDRITLLGLPTIIGDNSVPGTWGAGQLGPAVQLYDRCTKQSALIGSPDMAKARETWNEIKTGAATAQGPLLFWKSAREGYTVLDLARIIDSPCKS